MTYKYIFPAFIFVALCSQSQAMQKNKDMMENDIFSCIEGKEYFTTYARKVDTSSGSKFNHNIGNILEVNHQFVALSKCVYGNKLEIISQSSLGAHANKEEGFTVKFEPEKDILNSKIMSYCEDPSKKIYNEFVKKSIEYSNKGYKYSALKNNCGTSLGNVVCNMDITGEQKQTILNKYFCLNSYSIGKESIVFCENNIHKKNTEMFEKFKEYDPFSS